jgi:hypothetical protein
MKLKPCPCGEIPEGIGYVAQKGFSFAYGDCDCEWTVHFDMHPVKGGSGGLMDQAVKAWNEAPR